MLPLPVVGNLVDAAFQIVAHASGFGLITIGGNHDAQGVRGPANHKNRMKAFGAPRDILQIQHIRIPLLSEGPGTPMRAFIGAHPFIIPDIPNSSGRSRLSGEASLSQGEEQEYS